MTGSAFGLGVSAGLIILTCIVGMFVPVEFENQGGALVVDFGLPMFQINGMIFGGQSLHEYGHYLQQNDIGNIEYYATVAVPSVTTNAIWLTNYIITGESLFSCDEYHALSWEADANLRSTQ